MLTYLADFPWIFLFLLALPHLIDFFIWGVPILMTTARHAVALQDYCLGAVACTTTFALLGMTTLMEFPMYQAWTITFANEGGITLGNEGGNVVANIAQNINDDA